jgi:subtilisin family serine protease
MTARLRHRVRAEDGVALVMVLLASMLLLALGGALALAAATETAIASAYRNGIVLLYAAEAAAGMAMSELAAAPTWTALPAPLVEGRLDELLGVDALPSAPTVTAVIEDGAPDRAAIVAQARDTDGRRRTIRVSVVREGAADGRPSLRVVAWAELRSP